MTIIREYADIKKSTSSFYDKKNMTNAIRNILKLISKSKTRIDICCDYKMPKSLTIEDKLFKSAISDSKNSSGITQR